MLWCLVRAIPSTTIVMIVFWKDIYSTWVFINIFIHTYIYISFRSFNDLKYLFEYHFSEKMFLLCKASLNFLFVLFLISNFRTNQPSNSQNCQGSSRKNTYQSPPQWHNSVCGSFSGLPQKCLWSVVLFTASQQWGVSGFLAASVTRPP